MALLDDVKVTLRVTSGSYDEEIQDLIDAACDDLVLAGVAMPDDWQFDSLIKRAIRTYCRVHFGSPMDYDRLKASYDEQKAQLLSSSGYSDYSMLEGDE